ncbi:5-oxoprolinase subunit PxpB [Saliniramus sp.]|uniref:5-oxoprolinase subunit PxpB n=1 Tax=Saliniramus sp. TaxID=2986772 RepID=UPI002C54B935|nr:5-oxoprolinase subunit PxpB [Saliniramus sp.]HMB11275.1 5-oxoprolinase subunit PxpB [Saliniramus sp.]
MTTGDPAFLPCGDAALSVEFGRVVDPRLNALALDLDAALAAAPPKGLLETVPTYRALLVHFDPLVTNHAQIEEAISALLGNLETSTKTPRRWRVPVVYGGPYGVDLEDLAKARGLTPDDVIARHAGAVYTVAMLGFTPGFCYLAGLDPALATPRRTDPREVTPAGTIAIGGDQANIASIEAPSGWHLIGRTPLRNFMPSRDPAFLIDAGDEIVFAPIPEDDWAELDAAAAAGERIAQEVTNEQSEKEAGHG